MTAPPGLPLYFLVAGGAERLLRCSLAIGTSSACSVPIGSTLLLSCRLGEFVICEKCVSFTRLWLANIFSQPERVCPFTGFSTEQKVFNFDEV